MCGINGVTFKDEALIKAMVKATKHRGPDGEGVFVDEHISLGHNLLAITDSPDGCRQPAISQDGKYVLIYNGEIYNYKTLRKELGGLFRTGSDTEVLLAGLIKEGKDFIKKLNGMFAFAFYDVRKQTLLLARDAMGMKPLYYSLKNNKLIFSSEFRGLFAAGVPRQLDAEMEDVFLELGYIPGHRTLIKNVQKLTPGQGLEFDCNNGNLQTFWFSTSSRDLAPQHFDEAHLRDLLGSSVIDHTMGLRPFGMYLSGGLDSSIVLYELLQHGVKHVTTYTTRFDVADPKYNEDADIAARLSKDFDTKHHELLITEQNFMDALPKTIETLEEPRYHPSIPAYWLMAQEASKDTVVMLTGDGGDELFLGYPHYEESRRTKNSLWMTLSQTFKGKVAPGTYLNFRDPVVRWQFFIEFRGVSPKRRLSTSALLLLRLSLTPRLIRKMPLLSLIGSFGSLKIHLR